MLGVRGLFCVAHHGWLAKWKIVALVICWRRDCCHLCKLETNTFLQRVELASELARCNEFLRKEMEEVTTIQGVLEVHIKS